MILAAFFNFRGGMRVLWAKETAARITPCGPDSKS